LCCGLRANTCYDPSTRCQPKDMTVIKRREMADLHISHSNNTTKLSLSDYLVMHVVVLRKKQSKFTHYFAFHACNVMSKKESKQIVDSVLHEVHAHRQLTPATIKTFFARGRTFLDHDTSACHDRSKCDRQTHLTTALIIAPSRDCFSSMTIDSLGQTATLL
jgi:hypothetical protein